VLVVVVVRELGCGAFPIFVDVARRPAHFLWCGGSVRCRQQCYVLQGWQEAMRFYTQKGAPE